MAEHAKPSLNALQCLLGQANADLDDDVSLLLLTADRHQLKSEIEGQSHP